MRLTGGERQDANSSSVFPQAGAALATIPSRISVTLTLIAQTHPPEHVDQGDPSPAYICAALYALVATDSRSRRRGDVGELIQQCQATRLWREKDDPSSPMEKIIRHRHRPGTATGSVDAVTYSVPAIAAKLIRPLLLPAPFRGLVVRARPRRTQRSREIVPLCYSCAGSTFRAEQSMRFPSLKSERSKSRSNVTTDWLSSSTLQHSDRRSIAGLGVHGIDHDSPGVSSVYSPDDFKRPAPGLQRSHTVSKASAAPASLPSPGWSPDFSQLPSPHKQPESEREFVSADEVPMSAYPPNTPAGKISSDSGAAQERWSQRSLQRSLQRLNTEQGYREQRQGGAGVSSPLPSDSASYHSYSAPAPYSSAPESKAHAQPPGYQQAQPHLPASQPSYQGSRAGQTTQLNVGLAGSSETGGTTPQRLRNPYGADSSQSYSQSQSYSPSEDTSQYRAPDTSRPHITTQRSQSYSQQGGVEPSSMSSNNGNGSASKAVRPGNGHRQSVHSGLGTRDTSAMNSSQTPGQQSGVPAFNATGVPGSTQQQPYQSTQGEKYTKVKKYYFEKEDQVKQLQNSLAHQRLSQSRTSLDDTEYATRFSRLDGLVAQLAFSIRKSWRSVPQWLNGSVNKDAVATGKQEMTAAGRAFISSWLVEEIFNKVFHPDLDPALSGQLRSVQTNIRRYAPHAQTLEEEEYLTSKVVNWRLATLEGLQDALRSPQCPQNRAQLTEQLKERLVRSLAVHLQDPPPSDLEGGVHMIIELVVNVAAHLPLESRDVSLEYFIPGMSIMPEQMKMETGIPPLVTSIADDLAERASLKSSASDVADMADVGTVHPEHKSKRSMLSALTGNNKPKPVAQQIKHNAANGSSHSLTPRPDSASGVKEDVPPRVRIAAGIMVQIRGRSPPARPVRSLSIANSSPVHQFASHFLKGEIYLPIPGVPWAYSLSKVLQSLEDRGGIPRNPDKLIEGWSVGPAAMLLKPNLLTGRCACFCSLRSCHTAGWGDGGRWAPWVELWWRHEERGWNGLSTTSCFKVKRFCETCKLGFVAVDTFVIHGGHLWMIDWEPWTRGSEGEAYPPRVDVPPGELSQSPSLGLSKLEPGDPDVQALFLKLIRATHPCHDVQPLETQGGCSFTLLCIPSVTPAGSHRAASFILQIRPLRFAIPLPLMRHAQQIHSSLVAQVEELPSSPTLGCGDMQITQTSVLPGVRLSELLPRLSQTTMLRPTTTNKMKTLLSDLAAFHARAWVGGIWDVRSARRAVAQGKVGSSLVPRLAALAQRLPSRALRRVAQRALREVQNGGLEGLPVVLTHGDLIPSNLLVEAATWRLTGVVDWAEAEWLPFGISLYAVDILLGGLVDENNRKSPFRWYVDRAPRAWFYKELESKIGCLGRLKKCVRLARVVGVLLWFGFAWDDGRIDRVIDGKAWSELQCLKAYLRG
nr:hypothetical protein CFP56_46681 [Quercus suber]